MALRSGASTGVGDAVRALFGVLGESRATREHGAGVWHPVVKNYMAGDICFFLSCRHHPLRGNSEEQII